MRGLSTTRRGRVLRWRARSILVQLGQDCIDLPRSQVEVEPDTSEVEDHLTDDALLRRQLRPGDYDAVRVTIPAWLAVDRGLCAPDFWRERPRFKGVGCKRRRA